MFFYREICGNSELARFLELQPKPESVIPTERSGGVNLTSSTRKALGISNG